MMQAHLIRKLLILLACLLVAPMALAASESPAASSSAPTPEQVVKNIASSLAAKLEGRRDELRRDHKELIKVIDSVFLPHFDIDYASILVLGRHARQATPEQRSRFAKAFYDSITHRYAEGLLHYTKGRVEVLPYHGELDERRTIVRTRVNLDDGTNVSVDYAFRKTASGEWKAYDVIIEGISYITNYRNQVDAAIRQEGLEALIDRLQSEGQKALESGSEAKAN